MNTYIIPMLASNVSSSFRAVVDADALQEALPVGNWAYFDVCDFGIELIGYNDRRSVTCSTDRLGGGWISSLALRQILRGCSGMVEVIGDGKRFRVVAP